MKSKDKSLEAFVKILNKQARQFSKAKKLKIKELFGKRPWTKAELGL